MFAEKCLDKAVRGWCGCERSLSGFGRYSRQTPAMHPLRSSCSCSSTPFKPGIDKQGATDTAEALSALAGSRDGADGLFLYLTKLGISGAGLLEVRGRPSSSMASPCVHSVT